LLHTTVSLHKLRSCLYDSQKRLSGEGPPYIKLQESGHCQLTADRELNMKLLATKLQITVQGAVS